MVKQNRAVWILLFSAVVLGTALWNTSCDKSDIRPTNTASAVAATDLCSPLGVEMDGSQFRGSSSFALCKRGEKLNTGLWGPAEEIWITCRPESLRAGWKWHIWCNSDGSHCACDRNGILANPASTTCCAWTAGDHCTVNGEARPGQNGCASW